MEMHVHLKASNGRYCSVSEGGKGADGGSRILASAEAAQGWETFYLTRLNGPAFGPPLQLQSGDRVRLSSLRGHHLYLSGTEVRAGKAEPADAAVFIVERTDGRNGSILDGDAFHLYQEASPRWYVRTSGTNAALVCDGGHVTTEASFVLRVLYHVLEGDARSPGPVIDLHATATLDEAATFEVARRSTTVTGAVRTLDGHPAKIARAIWAAADRGGWISSWTNCEIPKLDTSPAFFGATTPVSAPQAISMSGDAVDWLLFMEASQGERVDRRAIDVPVVVSGSTRYSGEWAGLARPSTPTSRLKPLSPSGPVFVTLLSTPDWFRAADGSERLLVTGQIVNLTGRQFQISKMQADVFDARGSVISTNGLPLRFTLPGGGELVQITTMSETFAPVVCFNFLLRPAVFSLGTLRISGRYQTRAEDGAFSQDFALDAPPLDVLKAPVGSTSKGSWTVWNGPKDVGFNLHNDSITKRYAYDLVITNGGSTRPGAGTDNVGYLAWGEPIHAMARGEVVMSVDAFDDNGDGLNLGQNQIVIRHANDHFSVYAHIRKGSARVRPHATVLAGDAIAEIGNSGQSSEPHLHVAYWRIDETGLYRSLPQSYSNAFLSQGVPARGVLLDGSHFSVG